MTKNTYFLQIVDETVIGFHSEEIDLKNLPKGEKLIKVETNEPTKYLGLKDKEIFTEPLPEVNHDVTDRESLNYRRQELKKLFYEIKFTKELLEDTKDLEALYNEKLIEYNRLKEL